MTTETPLIWTTKGNVPADSLAYAARWEITDEFVKFIETWKDGDEVVKENAHVCILKGDLMFPETATFG